MYGHCTIRFLSRTVLLLGLFIGSGLARAEDSVSFDVQPRALNVGETTTCRITIRGERQAPAPNLPPIKGFELVGTSSEQSFSMGPEGAQSSVSYLYQLVAMEPGSFQIGPFGYRWNNQTYPLGPIDVSVVAGGASAGSASTRQEDFLFATLTASRAEAYVQQPLDLELALYWRDVNIDREVSLTGFDTTGLRLGAWQELPVTREVVREQVFEVRRFRCQAIPLTAGSFTLAPQLRVQILIRQARGRGDSFFGNSAFDDMLFGRFRTEPKDVAVPPLSLTIRDLPTDNRPAEFTGTVGQFRMEVQAQPLQINVGEPVTLTFRITGQGNLDTVNAPALAPGDDFRRYEAKLTGQDAQAGMKQFEMVVIPKHAGATNIPAITFAYFDPLAGRFERIVQDPIALKVNGLAASPRIIQTAENGSATVVQPTSGIDITHLKTKTPRWTEPALAGHAPQAVLYSVHSLPLLAFIAGWWIRHRRNILEADRSQARRKKAPRSARKALGAAVAHLNQPPAHQFYESVWQVLVVYFGNRFNLAPGQVSAEEVSRHLVAAGWSMDRVDEVTQLFDLCEGRRFGSGPEGVGALSDADQQAWRKRLDRLLEIMRECERLP